MKKMIAVLLTVMLLTGISLSAAEESQAPADFLQALADWAQNLNLDESDYSGSVRWLNSPAYEGTVRKSQGITEIELAGLGKAQVSEKKIMLDIGGKKYGVDLSKLMEWIQSFSSGEKKGFAKDLEMLLPWLEKAFKDIILPCVRINYSYDGWSVHIDADDETIRERTYTLIDEMIAERNTLETVLDRYGTYLSKLIPDMPRTFEELEKAWESEKDNPAFSWMDFNLGADLTYSRSYDGLSVSGRINLSFQRLFGANLTFELKSNDEGFDVLASLDLSNGRDAAVRSSNKLAIHCAKDKIEGLLKVQDNTYTLKAEGKTEESGLRRYTASLTGLNEWGGIFLKYDLEAVYDPADQSLKAALYETRDAGTSYESREKLADMEMLKGILGWEAELTLPFGALSLNLNFEDQYTRLKLEHKGLTRYDTWYLDAWLYYSPKEYLLKVETNLADADRRNADIYSLAFREDGMEFSVADERETQCHAKISYRRTMNGFEVEVEYLNKWERIPVISSRFKPSRLKFVAEGNRYRADLEWCLYGKPVLGATGTLDLDESGAFRRLAIDATQYDLLGIAKNRDYHLTVIPGTVTYVDQTGIYELRIVEDTAEKLAVVLTKDYKDELGSLVLTLDDQKAFSGVLTVMGNETGSIMITPIPKEPIDEITEENAFMIDFSILSKIR